MFKKIANLLLIIVVAFFALTACKKRSDENEHKHNYEWVITQESTHTLKGSVKGSCDCGDEMTKEIPALSDSSFWQVESSNVSCTKSGSTTYSCIYGRVTVNEEASGHVLSTLIDASSPSCGEYGYEKHYECVKCHAFFDLNKEEIDKTLIQIEKLEHHMDHVDLVKATSTKEGIKEHYHCSVCNKNFSDILGKIELSSISIRAGYGTTTGMKTMFNLNYPNTPNTPSEKNSWEYIQNEDYTLNWYVDVSSWVQPTGADEVSKAIKKATGITVKFETPVSDDGTKLATMIAGGVLPDVISIPTNSTLQIYQLANQGYIYDLNTLAEKWAPSLFYNLPSDVWDWWALGDNFTYGIPNHYYSYDDVYEKQLQPNGGMMVREDIFNAWQAYCYANIAKEDGLVHYTSQYGSNVGSQKTVPWKGYITTPEGFKQAAKWALDNYYSTKDGGITTGLLLSQFNQEGCTSLTWLSQFFAIPFEDEQGNFKYAFTEDAYKDMLIYLNDLYNEGIISKANFTYDYNGVGSVVAGGQAFATLVTPQDYQMHFLTSSESGKNYISMYITNGDGDAPVLADIRGYGYLMNMITTSCKRPDLVVKLFDYLTSDEGQLLIAFGPEGVTWNYTDESKTKIEFTDTYLKEKANGVSSKYGLMQFDVLINYQLYDNMQPQTNNGKTDAELYRTNLKRPLTIYSYDFNATHIVVDTTDKDYATYAQALSRINSLIGKQLPKIIQASTSKDALSIYNTTVETMRKYGLDIIIRLNSEAYQKTKAKLGITIAWPPYMDGYNVTPDRQNPNGDTSYYRGY